MCAFQVEKLYICRKGNCVCREHRDRRNLTFCIHTENTTGAKKEERMEKTHVGIPFDYGNYRLRLSSKISSSDWNIEFKYTCTCDVLRNIQVSYECFYNGGLDKNT